MKAAAFFSYEPPPSTGERVDTLLSHQNLVVERIVSSRLIESGEYVQAQDEWVMLLKGEATLMVSSERVDLAAGDYLFLPAGSPHSLESVSEGAVWLAIHLHPLPEDDGR